MGMSVFVVSKGQVTPPTEDLNGLGLPIGYGRFTTGGYGGTNSVVTNLNNSGAGSLRSFMEDATARWITFDPAISPGTITLSTPIYSGSNKTIDGRGTAMTLAGRGLYIGEAGAFEGEPANNVILHNFTYSESTTGNSRLLIGCNAYNVWFDHLTVNTGTADCEGIYLSANNVSCPDAPYNVTVSWIKFVANPANGDHGAFLISDPSTPVDAACTCTSHHNWFVQNNVRQHYMRWITLHSFNNFHDRGDIAVQVSIGGSYRSDSDIFREPNAGAYARVKHITTEGDNANTIKVNSPWLFTGGEDIEEFNTAGTFTPPYSYTAETANAALRTAIEAGAGAS